MATLKHIRKRITSVKSTQKITKAMKMVAAAKLRRAQHAVQSARPYAREIARLLGDVSARSVGESDLLSASPLFASRESVASKTLLVLFTSDRGLCGAFNASAVKTAIATIAEEKAAGRVVDVVVYGRKGRDLLNAKGITPVAVETDLVKWTLDTLRTQSTQWIERYAAGEVDRVLLIFNRFVSAISQVPTVKTYLPFALSEDQAGSGQSAHVAQTTQIDYEYEPNKAAFVSDLINRSLFSTFQIAYLESLASELGARMSAMDSATKNAGELIRNLTLEYNRARQAAITLELMDIVNGAESLS